MDPQQNQPAHFQQETFIQSLENALNREQSETAAPPARPKRGAKAEAAEAAPPRMIGLGIGAIIRGLVVAGIPWSLILTKILPDVVSKYSSGEKIPQIISEVVLKYLSGGYTDPARQQSANSPPAGGDGGQQQS